MHRKFVLEI